LPRKRRRKEEERSWEEEKGEQVEGGTGRRLRLV
jgi:hypothetical protein